jgi:ferredoxin
MAAEVGMKIVVDFDRCPGHARCMEIAPERFGVRSEGYLYTLDEEPAEAMRPKLERAVQACPTRAISIR